MVESHMYITSADFFGGWPNVNQGVVGAVVGGVLAGLASAIAVYFTNQHSRKLARREEARSHVIKAYHECMTTFIGVPDDVTYRQDLERVAGLQAHIELAAALMAELDRPFAQQLQNASNDLGRVVEQWSPADGKAIERFNQAYAAVAPLRDLIPNHLGNVETKSLVQP